MISDSNCENSVLPSVSIVRIIPKISERELFSHKKCFMGISLENPVFDRDSLKALLLWSVSRFEKCLFVIGDHLCRYNEIILNGLKNDEAIKAAHELGDIYIKNTKDTFEQLQGGKIQITRWQSHLLTTEYKKSRAILEELFASDSVFRASVEQDARSFVTRQTKRRRKLAVEKEEAIKLSSEYLLEEIAVFSALSEQGWQVELYPGSELQVLVEVAKNKHLNVPKGLKERISVELRIR